MEIKDLEGRTVKEAKTSYADGTETVIIKFEDGIELKVYPSLGHHLGTLVNDTTKVPWFMPWLIEDKKED